MNLKKIIIGATVLSVLVVSFILYRAKAHKLDAVIDPGFSEYITAFTSGTISSRSYVRIELAKERDAVTVNSEADEDLFKFDPGVEGKTYWIDNRTLEFRPDQPLKQGQEYNARFYLKKLVKDLPDKFKVFEFNFQTIKQAVAVDVEGYQPYVMTSLTWNNVTGVLRTADFADDMRIEKMFAARQKNNHLKVSWTHTGDNTHRFTIDSIQRAEVASEVLLSWNGTDIDASGVGNDTVRIPSIYDFSALEAKVIQEPQQYITIRFSDPLLQGQDLSGLVSIQNSNTEIKTEVDRMLIKIYPTTILKGSVTVNIEPGIKNVAGAGLKTRQTFVVNFESLKPEIRLKGKGVILPDSKGLIFPFEAVNIKAVDVKVIKIFEDNVSQFLQVNQLDGSNELRRAGRLIKKKTIRLDAEKSINFNKWNTFSIDLSEIIKQEPGAVYRIELSFKKEYSTYPCESDDNEKDNNMTSVSESNEINENEIAYWDSPGYDYDDEYYGDDYDWEERNDPCKASYFHGSKVKVARNVLASNIGIIAKGAADNTLTIAVSDLVTTRPKGGVEIEVYNYQRRKMMSGKSDADGMCTLALDGRPFLVIAKDGSQRGYLRVDDGSALSLSSFDVSGVTVQKGLKGFLYGERGVWRPGDTVYLTFVLEDKLKKLPVDHPVILEILNPQRKMVKRMVKTSGINGFYQFTFNTNADDPTGNYEANVKIGSTSFSKILKIETVKPNRLKINFDFPKDILTGATSAVLNAKWLHGATAKNLKANVSVTLTSTTTSFKGYEAYAFDDPVKKFATEEHTVFDGVLDENGNANVKADISPENSAPGMLKASFVTRVFETGGDFSIDRFTKIFSPYDVYIGVKAPKEQNGYLFTDTAQFFELATLTPEGKPVNRKNLEFKIYKLEWRWWWDSDEDDLANFASNTYAHSVFSTTVSTTNGKARVKYELKYPDWGRFLVRVMDPNGHTTGRIVYFDWPGWRGRGDRGDASGATMLMFSSDKKSYQSGEKATLTVPSSEGGRLLVSLESGSKVLKTFWVETKAGETRCTFDITEEMAPNVYAHVTYIQPHNQSKNDLPIRMYGVIPLLVENPSTKLTPVISMPDVMEPEKPVTIKINEKSNRKMTYTLAIVDEGLLDLTRFKTPDPWNSFYAREALGVKSWDLYDLVMGAYGGKIESLFAIGGDEDLKKGAGQKANRFKPIVKVLGPFTLNSGTAQHTITLPQYIGSVRVMVVAGNEGAYGNVEKTVPVRMPLMVLATLPRVVGPGEDVTLPVSVFAMEKNVRNFTVEVIPNEFFQVQESTTKNMSVKETGEYDLSFRMKVVSKEGIGKVRIIAKSGNSKSQYDIEINVRNPNSRITQFTEAMIEAGKNTQLSYRMIGMQGTNMATLEVSSIPSVDLSRRLTYLLEYPYGCVEQTTSGAFPQLYLNDFVELNSEARSRRDNNINHAIQRLNSMLVPGGGFGYWPGAISADDWGTSYAGHFMLEAEMKGYSLPSGFKRNWINYQKRAAQLWIAHVSRYDYYNYYEELLQAYRLYTLALAKEPDMGAMNRLKELPGLTMAAAWRLAAAYALAGHPEVGRQIVTGNYKTLSAYVRFNSTYGSDERDWAMMLETLSLLGKKEEAFGYVKKVAAALGSNSWYSTQTTAYGLLAIAKFLDGSNVSREMQFNYSINNNGLTKVDSKSPVAQLKLNIKSGEGMVSVNNTGKGLVFARVVTSGIPETGPANPIQNNLKVDVTFKDKEGNAIDIARVTQGTDFIAEVTVRNLYSSQVTNLALKQVFPSGWEIGNDRMDAEGTESSDFTYQDIRDDRVLTFFDLPVGTAKKFRVRLTAAYEGKFYFPGTLCEAMYEPGVNAFEPGKWIEVVK